jgi:tRNA threonylcarbamoyladenosine biosynthesis protein TsaE
MEITIPSLNEINKAARTFIEKNIGENKTFAFHGNMGAGKTTFIKAICEELGVTEVVNSPTFSILNIYEYGDGQQIYHFDFYRLNKVEEAVDFGAEDYFYSGNLCFFEWAEKVKSIIPADCVDVFITETGDGSRKISFERK